MDKMARHNDMIRLMEQIMIVHVCTNCSHPLTLNYVKSKSHSTSVVGDW